MTHAFSPDIVAELLAIADECATGDDPDWRFKNCPCGGWDCTATPEGPMRGCPYDADRLRGVAKTMPPTEFRIETLKRAFAFIERNEVKFGDKVAHTDAGELVRDLVLLLTSLSSTHRGPSAAPDASTPAQRPRE